MNHQRFSSIDEALASRPRAVQPAHDLWPRIAAELGQQADAPVSPGHEAACRPHDRSGRWRWPRAWR